MRQCQCFTYTAYSCTKPPVHFCSVGVGWTKLFLFFRIRYFLEKIWDENRIQGQTEDDHRIFFVLKNRESFVAAGVPVLGPLALHLPSASVSCRGPQVPLELLRVAWDLPLRAGVSLPASAADPGSSPRPAFWVHPCQFPYVCCLAFE